MKKRELLNLGVPHAAVTRAIQAVRSAAAAGLSRPEMRTVLLAVLADPRSYLDDPLWGKLAAECERPAVERAGIPRSEPVPYKIWGSDFEPDSLRQMDNACRLPVSVAGALMPDAHVGYGLPIGGVLATENAVIPYAVGMDIACRMKMTVLDLPVDTLEEGQDRLAAAIERETCFGVGGEFRKKKQHEVMDLDWSCSRITSRDKDKAWKQLGTSGSGNHFVEFGVLTVPAPDLGLETGRYLALLSHSGSRGTGGNVATFYSHLAMDLRSGLPKDLQRLAWLELDSEEGQEYWRAMQLMGRYAAANHELIHRAIAKNLGVEVLLDIENHHNFAWKERHFDRDLIIHRKGATPAGSGTLGIIPGSMGTPGYVVRGRGRPESLNSAAHGAGRRMSRKAAKSQYNWRDLQKFLTQRGVTLLSAGLDEVPMAYKDINSVMAAQADLVDIVARFDPRLVKMAPGGERPED